MTLKISRIGHHNDCFNKDGADAGTFFSSCFSVLQLNNYQAAHTKKVPMGGEMCTHPADWWRDQIKYDSVSNALNIRNWDDLSVTDALLFYFGDIYRRQPLL